MTLMLREQRFHWNWNCFEFLTEFVTKFVTLICDGYSKIWTKLTWNIVDDDKWVLLQFFSLQTLHSLPCPRPNSPVWKYKFHNKPVRISFWWMAEYLFVSIHTIRPYWTDCIPVYRPVPVSPLQKRLYRQNMLQYHHQDWNQCPLFHDLKTRVVF